MNAAAARARIALFAEGCPPTTSEGDRRPFECLWRYLAWRCAHVVPVTIVGISKGAIPALGADRRGRMVGWNGAPIRLGVHDPLDVTIAETHRRTPFDVAVVAFDKKPPNELLGPNACIRDEVDFVLTRFLRRKKLPPALLAAAAQLQQHYGQAGSGAGVPRPAGRPPRTALDFVCMVPEFESLVVADDQALRTAVGFLRRPNDWPWNEDRVRNRPVELAREVIDLARRSGVAPRGRPNFRADRHGWAEHILRVVDNAGRLMNHPITQRLATVLG